MTNLKVPRVATNDSSRYGRLSSWWILHVVILSGFAVGQPLFDLLGRNSTFFVAHRAGTSEIVGFALIVLFGPPLILVIPLAALAFIRKKRAHMAERVVIGGLFALAAVPPVVRIADLDTNAALSLGGLLTIASAWAYGCFPAARDLVSFMAPAPALFLALFLLVSPVRHLVLPTSAVHNASVSRSDTPVIVVVFDELPLVSLLSMPDGLIDDKRYVGFSRLAATSTFYPEATANVRNTTLSIPSILTGVLPTWGDIPDSTVHPRNLFTLLGSTHQMNVHEIVTRVCPRKLCARANDATPDSGSILRDAAISYLHLTLPADIAERHLPDISDRWRGFGSDDRQPEAEQMDAPVQTRYEFDRARAREDLRRDLSGRVERFLEGANRSGLPTVSYIHLMLPHLPWRMLPDGTAYNDPSTTGLDRHERKWSDSEFLRAQARQRHLLQVGYADRLLLYIIESLQHRNLFDDAMVIVTADHGANFAAGWSHREPGGPRAAEVLRVPLLLKLPHQKTGSVDTGQAELIDILPTIMDALNLDPGWDLDGRSLLSPNGLEGYRPRRIVTEDGVASIDDLGFNLDIDASLSSLDELFGSGGRTDDLFAWGPYAELVGRSLHQVETAQRDRRFQMELSNPALFDAVDPSSGFLPARLMGDFTGAPAEGSTIAVALNGVIAGVGEVYLEEEQEKASVMLSPRAFRPGHNSVEVFIVSVDGALIPVNTVNRHSYEVVVRNGPIIAVRLPKGTSVPVVGDRRLRGDVNEVVRARGAVTIRGWAADVETGRTPKMIIAVANGKIVMVSDDFHARAGVAKTFGDERVLMSGFDIVVPGSHGVLTDLTLIALYENSASRIPWSKARR